MQRASESGFFTPVPVEKKTTKELLTQCRQPPLNYPIPIAQELFSRHDEESLAAQKTLLNFWLRENYAPAFKNNKLFKGLLFKSITHPDIGANHRFSVLLFIAKMERKTPKSFHEIQEKYILNYGNLSWPDSSLPYAEMQYESMTSEQCDSLVKTLIIQLKTNYISAVNMLNQSICSRINKAQAQEIIAYIIAQIIAYNEDKRFYRRSVSNIINWSAGPNCRVLANLSRFMTQEQALQAYTFVSQNKFAMEWYGSAFVHRLSKKDYNAIVSNLLTTFNKPKDDKEFIDNCNKLKVISTRLSEKHAKIFVLNLCVMRERKASVSFLHFEYFIADVFSSLAPLLSEETTEEYAKINMIALNNYVNMSDYSVMMNLRVLAEFFLKTSEEGKKNITKALDFLTNRLPATEQQELLILKARMVDSVKESKVDTLDLFVNMPAKEVKTILSKTDKEYRAKLVDKTIKLLDEECAKNIKVSLFHFHQLFSILACMSPYMNTDQLKLVARYIFLYIKKADESSEVTRRNRLSYAPRPWELLIIVNPYLTDDEIKRLLRDVMDELHFGCGRHKQVEKFLSLLIVSNRINSRQIMPQVAKIRVQTKETLNLQLIAEFYDLLKGSYINPAPERLPRQVFSLSM